MKSIGIMLLALRQLNWIETVFLLGSLTVGNVLLYSGLKDGIPAISMYVFGITCMMMFTTNSLITVGVLRLRSKALNHVFTDVLKQFSDANGGKLPLRTHVLLKGFFGDEE